MKHAGICWDKKKKRAIQKKITIQLEEKKTQKVNSERKKIKKKSTKGKSIETKLDMTKQGKKTLSTGNEYGTATYQQPDARETEQFWSKIW